MTLEELVTVKIYLKKLLESNDYIGYEKSYNRLPDSIKTLIKDVNLEKEIDDLKVIRNQFENKVKKELDKIQSQIDLIIEPAKKEGYLPLIKDINPNHYTIVRGNNSDGQYLESNDEAMETIKTIIASYSNWQFPSLEIGCGTGQMTSCMVSADPLYVTDLYIENLESLKSKFNQIYQKRIRCYLNRGDMTKFEFLPSNQLQFILAWNVFNYYPQTELQHTLSSCWELLRPGGSILFSYSDCDYTENVKSFSYGLTSWLTQDIVEKILIDIGFEINAFHHYDHIIQWVEARKPGSLTTVKIHPSIGKISLG
jgi:SAM-dependent methyltransferase